MSTDAANRRAAVLGAIRTGLSARGDEPGRRGAVRVRLERAPEGIIPSRARQPRADLIAQLRARLETQTATVLEAVSAADVPQVVGALLSETGLPPRICCGTDAMIAAMPWDEAGIARDTDANVRNICEVGVTRALAAAAETGTLFFASGVENPSSLNVLPRVHIAIVREDAIAGSYEEAWRRLRAVFAGSVVPRMVALVSGPSSTADIEQTLVRGAHGPLRLAVIVVGGRSALDL